MDKSHRWRLRYDGNKELRRTALIILNAGTVAVPIGDWSSRSRSENFYDERG